MRIDDLIFGCGNIGGVGSLPELYGKGESEAAARELLGHALDLGIRSFDTAHSYGGGLSEAVLGRWLQTVPIHRRERLRVATKIGNPHGTLPGRRPLEASEVERQLSISLTRLKRDALDVVYLHEPDRATPLAETFAALEPFLARKQVLSLGLSNVTLDDVHAALAIASPRVRAALRFVQNEFHYLHAGDATALIPFLKGRGLAYVAFSPLAGGLLTGKYRVGEPVPAGSRLALRPEPYERFRDAASFARIEEFARIARKRGETLPRAALEFVLKREHASAAVIGARSIAQLNALAPAPRGTAPSANLPASV
jgi:aryl-alcohol dehydrogenase-like predicted oxidoreductase